MIIKKLGFICFASIVSISGVFGQDLQNLKFGKISVADFAVSSLSSDTGASAIIIKDYGKTEFTGSSHGFFDIVFTRNIRVKIVNNNGFGIAEYKILLFNNRKGVAEKITELKGSTYNMVNGSIQETKLDPKTVFEEKVSRNHNQAKFTMPALKAGSIYELSYTVKSNYFFDPPTWNFQHEYPCLWSEYEVTIPSMFHYLTKTRGDDHFDVKKTESTEQHYFVHESGGAIETDNYMSVSCTSFRTRWIKKNVPALKPQPYISTIENYLSNISFELSFFQQNETDEKQLEMPTWDVQSRVLLNSNDFGIELSQDNYWMDEDVKNVADGALNSEEEIRKIYDFVRDNFLCTDYSSMYVETSLRDVYKKRAGNVAELNLLLVAMLRHRHILADPAILSTRDNGVASKDYPLLYEYNYLICVAHVGSAIYKLDASSPFNSFNKLPVNCYNWGARIINEQHPDYLMISPDSVSEARTTNAMFINDDKGNFTGSITTIYGNEQSADIRSTVKKTSSKEFFKTIQTSYTDMNVSNEGFDSLNRPDHPLILHYDLDPKNMKSSDILYFNPVLGPSFETNPFAVAERMYPVEMSSKMDYLYLLTMEIPKGFQVDELPKSVRVKFNENEGFFEYLIQKNPDNIQMKVHLKFNRATFPTEEYANLREFFAFVVKKESEQIVFKKIK